MKQVSQRISRRIIQWWETHKASDDPVVMNPNPFFDEGFPSLYVVLRVELRDGKRSINILSRWDQGVTPEDIHLIAGVVEELQKKAIPVTIELAT